MPAAYDREEIRRAIRDIFSARGIDPAVAERVLQQESNLDPTRVGDSGKSFGIAQLYTGGGLGNVAQKKGISLDPSNWRQHLEFMADEVKRGKSWAPWHGARDVGIAPTQGIGGNYASAPTKPAYSGSTPMMMPTAAAAAAQVAAPDTPFSVTDLSKMARYNRGQFTGPVGGLVLHHTGGRGTAEGVINTLNQRGLGVHYVMDREGKVYQTLPQGARGAHLKPSERKEIPLSNANAIGIEVIAKNDADITDAQKAAITGFRDYAAKTYGFDPKNVYGHGHINSHKQATEGAALLAVLNGAPAPAATGAPTGAMAQPAAVPTLPADPTKGVLASTPDPFKAISDATEKKNEQQAAAMAASQAAAMPQPIQQAPAPPPPDPMQSAPIDYAGLLLPRIKRGLLADDYSSGLLGAA
jgi:hypothetical protein